MSIQRTLPVAMAALVLAFTTSPEVHAQDVGGDVTTTLRTLAATPTAASEDRALIRTFLDRDDVRLAATERAIDVQALAAATSTISDVAAGDIAERIRTWQESDAMAGGNTIVISASTVIIILLVLILVAVA